MADGLKRRHLSPTSLSPIRTLFKRHCVVSPRDLRAPCHWIVEALTTASCPGRARGRVLPIAELQLVTSAFVLDRLITERHAPSFRGVRPGSGRARVVSVDRHDWLVQPFRAVTGLCGNHPDAAFVRSHGVFDFLACAVRLDLNRLFGGPRAVLVHVVSGRTRQRAVTLVVGRGRAVDIDEEPTSEAPLVRRSSGLQPVEPMLKVEKLM